MKGPGVNPGLGLGLDFLVVGWAVVLAPLGNSATAVSFFCGAELHLLPRVLTLGGTLFLRRDLDHPASPQHSPPLSFLLCLGGVSFGDVRAGG